MSKLRELAIALGQIVAGGTGIGLWVVGVSEGRAWLLLGGMVLTGAVLLSSPSAILRFRRLVCWIWHRRKSPPPDLSMLCPPEARCHVCDSQRPKA